MTFTTAIPCPYEARVVGDLVAAVLGGSGSIAQLLQIAGDYSREGEVELAAWYSRAAFEVVAAH